MITRRALLTASAGALLAGCASAPDASQPLTIPPPAPSTPGPVEVRIPDIGVASALIGLGLAPDGTAAVPPVEEPWTTSWFEPGVKPGEVGPSVILGHRSGRPEGAEESVPGVFARLGELQPGAPIEIVRGDGSVARFAVRSVETFPKDAFPMARVWGDVDTPQLRAVTCGGAFDSGEGSYDSNVVAFADLVEVTP